MNADKSEMIRCAEASEQPTFQRLLVDGCGFSQRAEILEYFHPKRVP